MSSKNALSKRSFSKPLLTSAAWGLGIIGFRVLPQAGCLPRMPAVERDPRYRKKGQKFCYRALRVPVSSMWQYGIQHPQPEEIGH